MNIKVIKYNETPTYVRYGTCSNCGSKIAVEGTKDEIRNIETVSCAACGSYKTVWVGVLHNSNGWYSRKITSRGDRVYSKMLTFPFDYEDVEFTTEQMRQPNIIIIQEPFFLDEELRKKATDWVEWANEAEPKDYDPFADIEERE